MGGGACDAVLVAVGGGFGVALELFGGRLNESFLVFGRFVGGIVRVLLVALAALP